MAKNTALSIIRVSGDLQDETTQRDSCEAAAKREGLVIVDEIQLHAVSGFKGDKRHVAAMTTALARVQSGEIAAVVVAHSSRAARLPHRDVVRWVWDIEEAGGRVVSHDEQAWARGSSPMEDAMTILAAGENHNSSKNTSYHTNRTFAVMDANGYHRGWAIAGYDITCTVCGDTNRCAAHKGHKRLIPNPAGSSAVAQAFIDAANGKSTPAIARTFRSVNERHGTKLPVTPDGVGNLLNMREYSTGHHREGVKCQCQFPPLVSPAQQDAAVAALKARTTGSATSTRAISREDYSGALWCGVCGGTPFANPSRRMYRKYASTTANETGTSRRYACKSCNRSALADKTDAEVNRIMGSNTAWWYTAESHDPNAERDRQIANLDYQLDNLNRTARLNNWSRQQKRETEDALLDQRDKLAALPDVDPVTFAVHVTDDNGRQLTEGDRWNMMSFSERRDYLTGGSVFVYVRSAGDGRTGNVMVEVEYEQ